MVTTRGRRTSSLLEEPLLESPRKKKIKKELLPESEQEIHADESTNSRVRTRQSGTSVLSSSSASRSPEAKRVNLELAPSISELKRSSDTLNSGTKRKRHERDAPVVEELPAETAQVNLDPEHSNQEDKFHGDVSGEDVPQIKLLPSILSRQPMPEQLSLSKQFEHLLAQSPTRDLELHQQQSIVNQIVQWWESSGQHTSEVKSNSTPYNVSVELRNAAIPVLLNVSSQILHIFAYYDVSDIQRAVAHPDSEEGKVFGIYQTLFRVVKNLYPLKNGFILQSDSFHELPESTRAFGTANLATFISSCFGVRDVGFYHLHEHFFEVFTHREDSPQQQKLVDLYLELKTQACVTVLSTGERAMPLVLAEMLPNDFETSVLERLQHSKDDLITRANAVKNEVQNLDRDSSLQTVLKQNHPYRTLLQLLTEYANGHFEDFTGHSIYDIAPMCDNIHSMQPSSTRSKATEDIDTIKAPVPTSSELTNGDDYDSPTVHKDDDTTISTQPPNYAHPDPPDPPPPPEPEHATIDITPSVEVAMSSAEDIVAQAARAAQEALFGFSHSDSSNNPSSHSPYNRAAVDESNGTQLQTPDVKTTLTEESTVTSTADSAPSNESTGLASQSAYSQLSNPMSTATTPHMANALPYLQNHQQPSLPLQGSYLQASAYTPPNQSQPTAVLYERARQVANSKSSNVSRNKASNASQRRPWTLEEEQALMDGLDQVKGPHWSQILVLYGPGGSINETLRDRTQVQLKDKARNLKLFFLKSKIEVPYYLSFVTGELKSRAPSHVSAYDDTPPRSIGQANGMPGSHMPPSTSRNRIIPPVSMASHAALFNPIQHFTQSNGTYSSPYAALPGSPAPDLTNGVSHVEHSDTDDANHQNVADLADSAAAQVAAALANFNALDLPNFDMSGTGDGFSENINEANATGSMPPESHDNPQHESQAMSVNGTNGFGHSIEETDAMDTETPGPEPMVNFAA